MLDGLHDALGGLAVAVGVDGVRHSGISGLIVEQLACELYEGHLDAAADLCRSAGMHDVRIVEDFTGRPRIVLALVG